MNDFQNASRSFTRTCQRSSAQTSCGGQFSAGDSRDLWRCRRVQRASWCLGSSWTPGERLLLPPETLPATSGPPPPPASLACHLREGRWEVITIRQGFEKKKQNKKHDVWGFYRNPCDTRARRAGPRCTWGGQRTRPFSQLSAFPCPQNRLFTSLINFLHHILVSGCKRRQNGGN